MDGDTFHILKFRTMRVDAEATGAQMASKDDPRRTPIGTFLRKYSHRRAAPVLQRAAGAT